MRWAPTKEWEGQNAYVIGGGSSLQGFDFRQLLGRNTIGCNDAFRLGSDIVKVCTFGDHSWFTKNREELQAFAVTCKLVTDSPSLSHLDLDWLLYMNRKEHGIGEGNELGWNYSTGALALNLAISLGAHWIYLLGFDLGFIEGKNHWHTHQNRPTTEEAYQRFLRGFRTLAKDLIRFPDVHVVNVVNGASSRLDCFPTVTFQEAFQT